MPAPHISVLMQPILESFSDSELGTFIDGTLGAGGHASAILAAHPEIERFIGIDQDPEAIIIAEKQLFTWGPKVEIVRRNFSEIDAILDEMKLPQINGMLLDLGVSSMQLDRKEKGFSFSKEGPLDMRMDPENEISAFDVVNFASEKELGRIFREYGEEKRWRLAAKAIISARGEKKIVTTLDLAAILQPVLKRHEKKGINPLTLVFQALRIHVNQELERIHIAIPKIIQKMAPKGRLAIISFHSLEDRIVKNAFRHAASDKEETWGIGGVFRTKVPEVRILTKKPIIASAEESLQNPRSRSAKLRVIEKI